MSWTGRSRPQDKDLRAIVFSDYRKHPGEDGEVIQGRGGSQ